MDPDRFELHPDTIAVGAGRPPKAPGAPANQPPVLSSVFRPQERDDDGAPDFIYGRDGNDSWTALEEVLGALEGGRAVAFASGMAAAAAVVATLRPKKIVAPDDIYYGNRLFLGRLKEQDSVDVVFVDATDTAGALSHAEGAGLLWIETPSNPRILISDIENLASGAHELGATVLVDSTFASPVLQQPLSLGADVVLHSVSKYISGHTDVVMGALVARDAGLATRLAAQRQMTGAIPGPMEAFLALRGLRTLPLRIERAQANAVELAARLLEHPQVSDVLYPGLESHPGYEMATKQMSGPGAMMSFLVAGGADAAESVCERVRVIQHMTSLGGVESSIERRARYAGDAGAPDNLLRMSVGIENLEDLWRDLSLALG